MTFEDRNPPAERAPDHPPDVQLRRMWIFGGLGVAGVLAAIMIDPGNPIGWIMLIPVGLLAWFTRWELHRRRIAQDSHQRPEPGPAERRLPGSVGRGLPGSLARRLPGSVGRPLPGSVARPSPREEPVTWAESPEP